MYRVVHGRWAAPRRQTIAPAPRQGRREGRGSQQEVSFRRVKAKPSYCYTPPSISLYSISPLSLSSRHTVWPPPLPTKRQPTRGGQGKTREERGKASRECAPPSPFAPIGAAASREIRSAFPAAARARWPRQRCRPQHWVPRRSC